MKQSANTCHRSEDTMPNFLSESNHMIIMWSYASEWLVQSHCRWSVTSVAIMNTHHVIKGEPFRLEYLTCYILPQPSAKDAVIPRPVWIKLFCEAHAQQQLGAWWRRDQEDSSTDVVCNMHYLLFKNLETGFRSWFGFLVSITLMIMNYTRQTIAISIWSFGFTERKSYFLILWCAFIIDCRYYECIVKARNIYI